MRFEIASLTAQENEALQTRLGPLYEACGCVQATIALLSAFVLAIGFGVVGSLGWWRTGLWALGIGLGLSLAAKVTSRHLARARLRHFVMQELQKPGRNSG